MRRIAALLVLLPLAASPAQAKSTLTAMAAASTTDAMRAVIQAYEAGHDVAVRLAVAASSTLARQIEAGAPADLYLSANEAWMDYLGQRGLLAPDSRSHLLANRLVLIAPRDAAPALAALADLPTWLGDGRLVLGDPAHVPAGIYGKAALEQAGLWPLLAGRVVYTASVRDALAFVARGEAAAGLTYATDAMISRRIAVIASIPADLHPPIRYPVALIAGRDSAMARDLLAFLRSDAAARIFAAHGFTVLTGQTRGSE